jgi:hypothetical protein
MFTTKVPLLIPGSSPGQDLPATRRKEKGGALKGFERLERLEQLERLERLSDAPALKPCEACEFIRRLLYIPQHEAP